MKTKIPKVGDVIKGWKFNVNGANRSAAGFGYDGSFDMEVTGIEQCGSQTKVTGVVTRPPETLTAVLRTEPDDPLWPTFVQSPELPSPFEQAPRDSNGIERLQPYPMRPQPEQRT